MKAYQFDSAKAKEINKHFNNMKNVLKEVTETYSVVSELLEKHSEALQMGEVDPFRKQLQQTVRNAEKISSSISEQIQRLSDTSEHIVHHLDTAGQQAQSRLSHTHPQQQAPVSQDRERQQVRA